MAERTRDAPFSIRLTRDERRALEARANGEKLGSYIKLRLFAPDHLVAEIDSAIEPVMERRSIAQSLGGLGQSDLAKNISEIAHLACQGALPITPETESALRKAAADIAAMKSMLMRALRIKED